jgi:hypothetical protein
LILFIFSVKQTQRIQIFAEVYISKMGLFDSLQFSTIIPIHED